MGERDPGLPLYLSVTRDVRKQEAASVGHRQLLTHLTDWLPNLASEFMSEFSDTTLSESETTALLHFMAPTTVAVAEIGNPL